jgi:hypothetical protein
MAPFHNQTRLNHPLTMYPLYQYFDNATVNAELHDMKDKIELKTTSRGEVADPLSFSISASLILELFGR